MPLLSVQQINVFYGEVQALWGISFDVEKGEICTLIGSNGAGKTTSIKTVSGLLRPRAGSITFEGERIDTLPAHRVVERGIAQVPEGRRLWPEMSVEENLELGAYTKEARAKRKQTLARVYELFPRLAERRRQAAGTMSGGEQQMCAIGRGLMSLPKLLMLDEPSLGLAPKLVAEVFGIVREINQTGVTVLLVEQNVRHTLELATRAYVLETGRVALSGSGQELLNDPQVQSAYLGH
ncbi:MAG: branched-chain amino acid ABC transporter ATP-binding protein [Chloroflexi bacterium]|nr:MAG: branched-chain amino acid ABC transporter ATP-binding protein [Chloroflexota bacterium]